jgi:hypothetical protein
MVRFRVAYLLGLLEGTALFCGEGGSEKSMMGSKSFVMSCVVSADIFWFSSLNGRRVYSTQS